MIVRPCGLSALLLSLVLSGCSAPAREKTPSNDQASTENAVVARDAEISALKRELAAVKAAKTVVPAKAPPAPAPALAEDDDPAPSISTRPIVAMCFKDYCPCNPPQGGPDGVLCDQLEQGIEPDINLMIAGKGMREARRQMNDLNAQGY